MSGVNCDSKTKVKYGRPREFIAAFCGNGGNTSNTALLFTHYGFTGVTTELKSTALISPRDQDIDKIVGFAFTTLHDSRHLSHVSTLISHVSGTNREPVGSKLALAPICSLASRSFFATEESGAKTH